MFGAIAFQTGAALADTLQTIIALLIAGAATALEQLSGYGIDNLSVPLATALLWQQLSLSAPGLPLTP